MLVIESGLILRLTAGGAGDDVLLPGGSGDGVLLAIDTSKGSIALFGLLSQKNTRLSGH